MTVFSIVFVYDAMTETSLITAGGIYNSVFIWLHRNEPLRCAMNVMMYVELINIQRTINRSLVAPLYFIQDCLHWTHLYSKSLTFKSSQVK